MEMRGTLARTRLAGMPAVDKTRARCSVLSLTLATWSHCARDESSALWLEVVARPWLDN